MSGVVSRLTNRIFGLAPVARVRLPARFEVSGAAFAGSAGPAEITAEAPAARPPQPGVSQVVERWTPPAQPVRRPDAGEPRRTVAPQDKPRMAAPPGPAPRQVVEHDALPSVPQPAAAPREAAAPRAAAPLAGSQPVPAQPPQSPAAVAGARAALPRPTPAPPPGIAVLPELQRPRRHAPIAAPAAPAQEPPRARPAAPVQPAPVVPEPVAAVPATEPLEIIIGRIDVRAPAPRAPATPSVSAGLQRIPSLAAYLATKR
ncbi:MULTISPECIES: hypothetical protein [unclassified Mesorhizobium]|uniref:hypothetical protein n=1 Tax=unclassified Mesorhizobium TaxID=325217 RepID=UPI000F75BA62|nr:MULTISPECIES: hypothetical protein [unclassified Mesorhizobium]AZO55765.1 hypothetical protein EJ077_21815 [Mesorhizobium sp. M8A.F.Ca.ET.057.01.1.1]RWE40343.1 MAG: hypothetical protein EOS80_30610 [Mesorhizobium sp.]